MTGWSRIRPIKPGDGDITARSYELHGRTMLKVRVPIALAEAYDIDEGDRFQLFLDGHGQRLKFQIHDKGDVTAKSYGRKAPIKALTFTISMLSFESLFSKQKVEHDKLNGDLVITLPQKAAQAVS